MTIVCRGGAGAGTLGTLSVACLDKHTNKHINIQLGIFHASQTIITNNPLPPSAQPWSAALAHKHSVLLGGCWRKVFKTRSIFYNMRLCVPENDLVLFILRFSQIFFFCNSQLPTCLQIPPTTQVKHNVPDPEFLANWDFL